MTVIVTLATSWLIFRRGWNKVLPIFSSYVVFYWLSIALMWPLTFWNRYPPEMQRTICLIYAKGAYALSLVGLVLVVGVLYELSRYTFRNQSTIQPRWMGICGVTGVIAALAMGLVGTFTSMRNPDRSLFENFAYPTIKSGSLIVAVLLVVLIVGEKKFALPWGRSVSLIVAGLSIVYGVEIAASIVEYKLGGHMPGPDVTVQIAGLICPILWLLAVRMPPDHISAVGVNPAN